MMRIMARRILSGDGLGVALEQFRFAQDGICAYVIDGKIVMIPFLLNGFTKAMDQVGA